MSKKSQGGSGKIGLFALLLILVCLVVAIVGVCISWVNREGALTGTTGVTLSDLFDAYGEAEGDIGSAFDVMAAFAILSVILAAVTAILAGIARCSAGNFSDFCL